MNRLVKGIGSGIGLAAEAIAHKKEKKALEKERSRSPNPQARSTSPYSPEKLSADDEDDDENDSDDFQGDDEEWALDAAAVELDAPPSYDEIRDLPPQPVDEVVSSFMEKHPPQRYATSFRPLPCPVILPQRRPKDKSRGFIRAYAPVLGECAGIDQQTFLDFLNDFHKSSQASPVFHVINAGAMIAGMVPNPIVMGVSIAIQVAAGTAQELQARSRTNTFLDQINTSLFKPRGLYAMIMTFKPERPTERYFSTNINDVTSAALTKYNSPPTSGLKAGMRNIRLSSGVSQGELSLPESAPLVYPALDAAAASVSATDQGLPEDKQNALKSSGGFISNYLDRRAQAEYSSSNPGSKLAVPPPSKQFASRYSDPNHPANSGTILGLLTGGHYDPKARRRGRKAQRKARRRGIQLTETDIKNAEMGRRPMGRQGLIRRVLQKNVLYLMIVNLPTQREMDEVMRGIEREDRENEKQMEGVSEKEKYMA